MGKQKRHTVVTSFSFSPEILAKLHELSKVEFRPMVRILEILILRRYDATFPSKAKRAPEVANTRGVL